MATFITSKAVGESITIAQQNSTGYWKYNHDGSDSSVFASGLGISTQTITVANANGEFTIISCLVDGTPSGNIIYLGLTWNQLTSFDPTGLTSLTKLNLQNNQLTSFDGTGLTSLNHLYLGNNPLTSFDPTGLSSLTSLALTNTQLTSFDGTGLSSLIDLYLSYNQLTSFNGTGLSSLIDLELYNNQLTSFDGTGLTSLTKLNLQNNQLTSFDGTGLTSLNELVLVNNLLTSIDVSPMVALFNLFLADVYGLNGNPITATANNNVLTALVANGVTGGNFSTANGRTSDGTADYNTLIAEGWKLVGLELVEETTTTTTEAPTTTTTTTEAPTTTTTTAAPSNPTFITSKGVGETITINVTTSTGYWKYNHNGTDSSVFSAGYQTITVANANGEFTIISCLSDGTVSGDITYLNLSGNQLTSFNGTGLTSLIELYLGDNQLTSFDGTDLTNLTSLRLQNNQLTSFDGTGLTSLTELYLDYNELTSLDGFILPTSLTELNLNANYLTSFDLSNLSNLSNLSLENNSLTSLSGFTFPTSLTTLGLNSNGLTSFDLSGLDNLQALYLEYNYLTSFDGTDLTSLTDLYLRGNGLTSIDEFIFPSSLTGLNLNNNQLTSFDGTGLTSLWGLFIDYNQLTSINLSGLTNLQTLNLQGNQLTSLDVSSLTNLLYLFLYEPKGGSNPMTPSSNDSILHQLNLNGVTNGQFWTSGGRTSAGTSDYDYLIANGWTLIGLELITPPSGNGKLRIKGVNSGGGTTTTTTTEAPTTTTTTTEAPTTTTTTVPPSLYWDSITLGSVDVDGILSLNIDFTELGFNSATSANNKTFIVIPNIGPSTANTRVMIDGVEYAFIPVSYSNLSYISQPVQDPSVAETDLIILGDYVTNGRITTTDQVKLAVVNQIDGALKKSKVNTYVTDSLSSTIGTVQNLLDLLG